MDPEYDDPDNQGDSVSPLGSAEALYLARNAPIGSALNPPEAEFMSRIARARRALMSIREPSSQGPMTDKQKAQEAKGIGVMPFGEPVGPSNMERLLAIGNAFGAPTTMPGFAGTMQNVGKVLLEQEQAKRAALQARQDLIDKYALESATREYDLEKTRATQQGAMARTLLTQQGAAERAALMAGKPINVTIGTNPMGEQVQYATYADGSIVQTNLSPERRGEVTTIRPGQTTSAAVSGETTPSTSPAGPTYEGADGKRHSVGDVFVGPDRRTYRMLSGGKTEAISEKLPENVRPANQEEALRYGYLTGQIVPSTGEFKPFSEKDKAPPIETLNDYIKRSESGIRDAKNEIARFRDIVKQATPLTTGAVGSVAKFVPGSAAYNMYQQLKSVSGKLALEALMQMKSESPNGASGLGSLAVAEFDALKNSIAALDQAQSLPVAVREFNRAISHYERIVSGLERDIARDKTFRSQIARAQGLDPDKRPAESGILVYNPKTRKLESQR